MLTVSSLHIYPVKSLAGITVPEARLTDRGFEYDRRWILVDDNNQFLTQREIPGMALVKVEIQKETMTFLHQQFLTSTLVIPLKPESTKLHLIQVWDDQCQVLHVSKKADEWFSDMLSYPCRLMYMPDHSPRPVDEKYAFDNNLTNLSDAFPIMMIGQASLDDLNARLEMPLPMNRFRPNIVFTNGSPYEEDEMEMFKVGGMEFYGVKLCGRCNITTIDQQTSIAGKEPLRTLSSYRKRNNNVYFGQNLLYKGEGSIRTGDTIDVVRRKASAFSKVTI
ncbi:MAG TPA: MOSC N-terminal beta barrel domain-containing protein [Chitinophagaceae bacterium]|nr:MOSC N-terminal beta barrel domain-containing protein [Chitinophagaceae bacterium]